MDSLSQRTSSEKQDGFFLPPISLSKSDFHLRKDVIFLNHGSYGACPKAFLAEQARWTLLLEEQPVLYFRELNGRMRAAREALGSFIGAKPENLVYVANATYGVNVVAQALSKTILKEGDEILATDQEYGACKRAWMEHAESKGIKYVEAVIPIPCPPQAEVLDLIWSRVTPWTKLLFVSHITSPTAIRFPVEELIKRAKSAGIITLIDGAHAPGQLDLDLSTLGADMYTGNCHKWMCTPKGTAFLWASDQFKDKLTPLVVSWGSWIKTQGDGFFIDENEYLGTKDYGPQISMPFCIKWMKDHDWPLIQQRCRKLKIRAVDLLCTLPGVKPLLKEKNDPLTQLGAVLLPDGTNTDHLKDWLYNKWNIEVVVHKWLGHPILRVSVHAHTSDDDINLLIKAMSEYLQSGLTAKRELQRL